MTAPPFNPTLCSVVRHYNTAPLSLLLLYDHPIIRSSDHPIVARFPPADTLFSTTYALHWFGIDPPSDLDASMLRCIPDKQPCIYRKYHRVFRVAYHCFARLNALACILASLESKNLESTCCYIDACMLLYRGMHMTMAMSMAITTTIATALSMDMGDGGWRMEKIGSQACTSTILFDISRFIQLDIYIGQYVLQYRFFLLWFFTIFKFSFSLIQNRFNL